VEKPLEFKARKKTINGKVVLEVQPIVEVTKHADGIGQDVKVKLPCLNLLADAKKMYGIK